MTQPAGTEEVLRNYVKAVEDGDVQTISELFAEDAMWRLDAGDLPISGTWTGRDRIMSDFLAKAMSHYEPGTVELEITGLIASGDEAVLQWTSRAKTRTGRPYENGCIAVFTIRDGRIQAVREYMDTLYAGTVAFGAGH
jgi:ketosteroid isomerase-like protein